jgi:hypothetical protein
MARRVARIPGVRNSYIVLVRRKIRDKLADLGVDGRKTLKLILKE